MTTGGVYDVIYFISPIQELLAVSVRGLVHFRTRISYRENEVITQKVETASALSRGQPEKPRKDI